MPEKESSININTADFDTLAQIPKVGDKRAQFILDHRPFNSWEEMKMKIPQFSDSIIDDIRKSNITFGE